MAKKQLDGYSFEEALKLVEKMVDESAERLRMRLRAEWKKQAVIKAKRKNSHEYA